MQILHNRNYHWVVISHTNCSKNEIDYYDSLFHDKTRNHEKLQICNIFKWSRKELKVNVKAYQQQTNGANCGVFTVVNLFYI